MTELATPPLDPDSPDFIPQGTNASEDNNTTCTVDPPVQVDYFGFAASSKFMFPDGISYIEISVMNEGAKSNFQKRTQRDVVMERKSGDARFTMNPAQERHALITECSTGWNLLRGGNPVPFNDRNLRDWLLFTDPRVVEKLEAEIRKLNPWLQGDMTADDIREQINQLEEQLKIAIEREQGK